MSPPSKALQFVVKSGRGNGIMVEQPVLLHGITVRSDMPPRNVVLMSVGVVGAFIIC